MAPDFRPVTGSFDVRYGHGRTTEEGVELSLNRPRWPIDSCLEQLHGRDVRVAARAFSPPPSQNGKAPRFVAVRDLYLPDNSRPAGSAVFFEGRLLQYERQIGVVWVWLDAIASIETTTAEGHCLLRGRKAVIVRGPAIVELDFPFQVEQLPVDPTEYWQDLRF